MRFLLLTTTDMKSDRAADFSRMIRSVAASAFDDVSVAHVILLQRCSEEQRHAVAADIPYPATVLADSGRLSLSAARNVMLAHVREAVGLDADAIVAFPDDDCWYTPGFLPRLAEAFRKDAELGLLITRISLAPADSWDPQAQRVASATDVLRRSTSNCIFLRGDVVARIGDFDPTLGLGTPNVSGEDTDYALRAWFVARRTVFVDRALVGHHEPDLDSVTRYFGGNTLVAGRYALRSPALFFEFARKFAVGGYLVIRKQLKIGDFVSAIQGGMGALRRNAGMLAEKRR